MKKWGFPIVRYNNFEKDTESEDVNSSNISRKLVVFLHGMGSDGYDLIALSDYFKDIGDDVICISPHAKEKFDMMPYGYQWFSIKGKDHGEIVKRAEVAINDLESDIINVFQKDFNLTNADTILVGFSQGAMMASMMSLNNKTSKSYFAAICFCGRLAYRGEIDDFGTKFCLIHGKDDEIIEYSETVKMAEFLNKNNISNEYHIIENLKHSIDLKSLEYSVNFIKTLK
ncbi:MAG TPA: hydrolase [Candidatus Megaira endosymbiont of Hartmannula sinica]|nr:hydrolase [Candidatus Megaera endosymbiont of Hartmannula sinica]